MIAQKITPMDQGNSKVPDDSLAASYLKAQEEMARLHDGGALTAAGHSVLSQLPAGSLTLLATSAVGVAIAGACAALRDEPTRWTMCNLSLPAAPIEGRVIVVDPVDGGEGWRDA